MLRQDGGCPNKLPPSKVKQDDGNGLLNECFGTLNGLLQRLTENRVGGGNVVRESVGVTDGAAAHGNAVGTGDGARVGVAVGVDPGVDEKCKKLPRRIESLKESISQNHFLINSLSSDGNDSFLKNIKDAILKSSKEMFKLNNELEELWK